MKKLKVCVLFLSLALATLTGRAASIEELVTRVADYNTKLNVHAKEELLRIGVDSTFKRTTDLLAEHEKITKTLRSSVQKLGLCATDSEDLDAQLESIESEVYIISALSELRAKAWEIRAMCAAIREKLKKDASDADIEVYESASAITAEVSRLTTLGLNIRFDIVRRKLKQRNKLVLSPSGHPSALLPDRGSSSAF